ncbi:MAG: thioesterase family protein [Marmoricola sp.]
MGYEYDAAIAVAAQGEGCYTAELDGGWMVGGGINGGYLLGVLGNAISADLAARGHADPYTVSAYYLSASRPGPATVRVEVLRAGRGTTTVRATLSQDHEGAVVDRISVLATYGDLGAMTGDVLTRATPPALPPVEECVLTSDAPPDFKAFVPMLDRFAMRLDPAYAGGMTGRPSGTPLIQGWFELADRRPIDPIALLTVVDLLPPTTFELGMLGWAPTLELTVHVRCAPAPGLLRLRHETRNMAGGFFEEDCEVWDAAGRLVAQSRQLALMPRPR